VVARRRRAVDGRTARERRGISLSLGYLELSTLTLTLLEFAVAASHTPSDVSYNNNNNNAASLRRRHLHRRRHGFFVLLSLSRTLLECPPSAAACASRGAAFAFGRDSPRRPSSATSAAAKEQPTARLGRNGFTHISLALIWALQQVAPPRATPAASASTTTTTSSSQLPWIWSKCTKIGAVEPASAAVIALVKERERE
jgi:hypothetical protein